MNQGPDEDRSPHRGLWRGAQVTGASQLGAAALGMLTDIALVSVLTPAAYGAWHTARRATQGLAVIATRGDEAWLVPVISSSLSRGLTDHADALGAYARRRTLNLGLLIGLALGLLAGFAFWARPNETSLALAGLAPTIPLLGLIAIAGASRRGAHDVGHAATLRLVTAICLIFSVILIGLRHPLRPDPEALLPLIGLTLIGVALTALLAIRPFPEQSPPLSTHPEIDPSFLPFLGARWLATQGALLGLAASSGPVEAARYAPIALLSSLLGLGAGALTSRFAPAAAHALTVGDQPVLQRAQQLVVRGSLGLALPVFVVALIAPEALLAPWSVAHGQGNALRAALLGELLWVAVGPTDWLLLAAKRPRDALSSALAGALPATLGAIALSPTFGALGAGLAHLLGGTLSAISGALLAWRATHVHALHPALLRVTLAAVPGAIAVWFAAPALTGLPPGFSAVILLGLAAMGPLASLWPDLKD